MRGGHVRRNAPTPRTGRLLKATTVEAIPEAVRKAGAGEAAVSGQLSMKLMERLRVVAEAEAGVRPSAAC
ncbi:MAG: hypothetical protein AVDCRST_MAG53-1627 [uncultured Solirubrobacteraceae bacterium]|uniref:Uncharacterized protein n=1 Tax=uncultured Solirubrobacteraceae bacterium TaxID=1162706 RepID=A0A6J4S984_9ACTN|nr:MAG: hypothetical protein AVDCRST_MAG53-1627 [uncultured Solirubrobacteraceae bacterium]